MFRPQAGMTDPYINETVTYVAELDEEAIRKEIWQPFLCFFIFNLILGIIFPLFCIIPWIMFCCVMNHANSTAEGTQVYITENTLVYVEGDQFSRVTVPLTSIATVMVQPPDLLINIKPTAPKEVLSRACHTENNLVCVTRLHSKRWSLRVSTVLLDTHIKMGLRGTSWQPAITTFRKNV